MQQAQYDTISSFQAPEGVEPSLSPAGPFVRANAWLIDCAIKGASYLVILFVLQLFGGLGVGVSFLLFFLIERFNPVAIGVTTGATPGKAAMPITVVQNNGTPIGLASSLLGNLIGVIDFLPLGNVVGVVTMVLNAQFKRLGDIDAGYLVVYTNGGTKNTPIPEAPPTPSPIPLRGEEQCLILDFCERCKQLTLSRKNELAELLVVFTDPEKPAEKLVSSDNWFMKGRGAHASAQI
ncbi:MAG: RDD family protein [Desulfobulbus propionicus]|nr:MAG: RDD family protein [Desulfobulbus propionicus]